MSKPNLLRGIIGDNSWYKLFTGLLLRNDLRKKVAAILVDIVCETKETSVIYSGVLEKFDIIADTRQLDYITLSSANRRDLRQGAQITETAGTPPTVNTKTSVYINAEGVVYPIQGQYLTIPGNKISNVNVTYLQYVTTTDAKGNVTNESWEVIKN